MKDYKDQYIVLNTKLLADKAVAASDLELEEQDRRGYLAKPQQEAEFHIWEDAAEWPEH